MSGMVSRGCHKWRGGGENGTLPVGWVCLVMRDGHVCGGGVTASQTEDMNSRWKGGTVSRQDSRRPEATGEGRRFLTLQNQLCGGNE